MAPSITPAGAEVTPTATAAVADLDIRPLAEWVREWRVSESTARKLCDRVVANVRRIGGRRVLTQPQADQLHAELARRRLLPATG